MKSALILFLAAAILPATAASAGTPVTVRQYAIGQWTIAVRRNGFSQQIVCQLRGPHIRFQRGAVGFDTHTDRGVSDAWYRIDGAAARPWRDRYPMLVEQDVSIESGGLDDPTRGIVWLPLADLARAHTVIVQVRARGGHVRLKRFSLKGLAYMHDAATRLGCPVDGYVV